jgi:nitrate reductase gamma subunit
VRGYESLGWGATLAPCLELEDFQSAIECIRAKGVPYADNCDACHPGEEFDYDVLFPDHTAIGCETCHQQTRPPSHDEDFTEDHGPAALQRAGGCTVCHDRDDCNTCHEGETPAFHEAEDYDHGADAKRDSFLCRTCHDVKAYCTDCHDEEDPEVFPSSLQVLHPPDHHDQPSCSVCHENEKYADWGLGTSELEVNTDLVPDGLLPHARWSRAENQAKWKLMWWFFVITCIAFVLGVLRHVVVWLQGGPPEPKGVFNLGGALKAVWREAILQNDMRSRDRVRWWAYAGIHFGFFGMFFGFVIVVITRHIWHVPVFEDSAAFGWAQSSGVTPWAGFVLDGFIDICGLFCFIGILIASGRRWVWRSPMAPHEAEDMVSLTLLLLVILTGFCVEVAKLAPLVPEPAQWVTFASTAVARFLSGIEAPWTVIHYYLWLVHLLITFVFLAYLPYGKLIHAITSPLSVALEGGQREKKGQQHVEG